MAAVDEPVFAYPFLIQRRELTLEVTVDGFIYWDDYQERRRLRPPSRYPLEMRAFFGDDNARKRLNSEIDEFTVSFELSKAELTLFQKAGRLFRAGKWTQRHEKKMDKDLAPMFWEKVNPYLTNALTKE